MKKHQPLEFMPSYEGNADENSTAGFFSISVILSIDGKQLKNCHSTKGQVSDGGYHQKTWNPFKEEKYT